ncbi:hypothetical protein PVAP13_1NG320700 [Panicum virgatum]|uniref:Phosphatidic acid phosphatase type 2/haloperoxidase domain-containing protein n=1 Tax=Panicum virgatum TaxID=38727 RepID=A0A8T0WZK3_PANVG|nr:hypothetical protein PVAP13_1NG320700 [Panicum virgatum]
MSSLLLQSPGPRLLPTAPSSRRHLQCKEHLLLPRRRPRVRLGARMAETAWVESGCDGASPEVGVSVESDPILGREESPGQRREASLWEPVEAALNLILKRMLNHERPSSALRSDPGMPSSHTQSIFYFAIVLILSLYYWIGTNYLTVILGPATLSVSAYLSWLRVSQRLHTLNQVMVGAAVGSAFGALWFVLWHSLVQVAFAASPLVRIVVILGSSVSFGFVIYAIRQWLKDE